MNKLSLKQHETARNIQKQISASIEDKGREFVQSTLGISKGTTSKFCSGDHPDECKINIKSLSELLAGLDVSICPSGYIPVEKSTVAWAWMSIKQANGGVGPQLKMLRDHFEEFFGSKIGDLKDD